MQVPSGRYALPHDIEQAWPEIIAPNDPDAGDEALPDPAHYEDWVRFARRAAGLADSDPAPLCPEEHRRWDDEFLEQYRRVLAGEAPVGATDAAAQALLVHRPPRHDMRAPHPGPTAWEPGAVGVIPDAAIVEIAEDWLPEIGLAAPSRVLGPWAGLSLPRHLRTLAGAVMAFSPCIPPAVRPVGRAVNSKPKTALALRQALTRVLQAPPCLYRIVGHRLEPLMPLSERRRPPVEVSGIPSQVQGCEGSCAAVAVVGRALPVEGSGWWLTLALPLSIEPDPEPIVRRMFLEHQRLRRHDHRLTWEDTLRDRGEVLYRAVAEWCWEQGGGVLPPGG